MNIEDKSEPIIRKLVGALEACVEGMRKSQVVGCTDHLDCWDGAGFYWYGAIKRGEAVAAEARKAIDGDAA